jgi:hypothetical protein
MLNFKKSLMIKDKRSNFDSFKNYIDKCLTDLLFSKQFFFLYPRHKSKVIELKHPNNFDKEVQDSNHKICL